MWGYGLDRAGQDRGKGWAFVSTVMNLMVP